MNLVPYIGYVAGAMTVISYAPQAVRAWKTKKVADLSWGMIVLLTVAGALWIVYGVTSKQPPVVITNCLTTLLTATILVAKMKYRDNG